jgi:predicted lipid-binding transport protein (Tim44 family)
VFARSSTTSSSSKTIEGNIEGQQDTAQREEADPIVALRESKQSHKPFNREISLALGEIERRDRSFSVEDFLRSAAAAYEEIAMAFASGNRKALEDLTSRDVLEEFSAEILERERRGEQMETRFVRIAAPELTNVRLSDGNAELSVRFRSELFRAVRNKSGEVIRGSPNTCTTAVDIWTFARPLGSQRPQWKLIASNLTAG